MSVPLDALRNNVFSFKIATLWCLIRNWLVVRRLRVGTIETGFGDIFVLSLHQVLQTWTLKVYVFPAYNSASILVDLWLLVGPWRCEKRFRPGVKSKIYTLGINSVGEVLFSKLSAIFTLLRKIFHIDAIYERNKDSFMSAEHC